MSDLLRIVALDTSEGKDELTTKLTSTFAVAIKAVREKSKELIQKSTIKTPPSALCPAIWQGITDLIETGRKAMMDVLSNHGMFVIVDSQPSISKDFFHKFEHFLPKTHHTYAASKRVDNIKDLIEKAASRNYVGKEKEKKEITTHLTQIAEAVNTQVQDRDLDPRSISDIDEYVKAMQTPKGLFASIMSLRVVRIFNSNTNISCILRLTNAFISF